MTRLRDETHAYNALAAGPQEPTSSAELGSGGAATYSEEVQVELEMPGFVGLIGLYAVQVVSSFDNALVLPSMYLYVQQLSANEHEAHIAYGVAQFAYFACRVCGQIAMGRWLDGGRSFRWAMAGCLAISVCGSLAYVLASGVRTLVLGRCLLGLGSSVTVCSLSFVSTFIPKKNRTALFAKLMGLQRSSTPIAPLVVLGLAKVRQGPVIGPLNAPGVAVGAFNIAALGVVCLLFREPSRSRKVRHRQAVRVVEVLSRTGAWVSYVLSFQNNWNNQVVVWTLPLFTTAHFGASPARDAWLFASGGFVGLCTAFALSKRRLCSTDRATIVASQIGVGACLACLTSLIGCGALPRSLPLLWCLFSIYYAPFISQMPSNNAMYSKLVSDYKHAIGLFQSVLEVSKSAARALAGLAIGQAYASAGPCALWLSTLAIWAGQFLPLAIVWPKLDAADAPKLAYDSPVYSQSEPDYDDENHPQGALALVPQRHASLVPQGESSSSLASLFLSPLSAARITATQDALDPRLCQGFVSPPSLTFLPFAIETQML